MIQMHNRGLAMKRDNVVHASDRQRNNLISLAYFESGRSMVEMLGVLAIMGVLTYGVVSGLRSAFDKHRANSIIQALSRRATVLSAEKSSGSSFTDNASFGTDTNYTITCLDSSSSPFFTCTVANVEQRVCQKILSMNWEVPYYLTPKECAPTNTLTVYFKSDLGNDSVTACPSGLFLYNGSCVPPDTPLENGCTANAPILNGNESASGATTCRPCTANQEIPSRWKTDSGYRENHNLCSEVCPNRHWVQLSCNGHDIRKCILTTAPNPDTQPLLTCSGTWSACPSGNNSVKSVGYNFETQSTYSLGNIYVTDIPSGKRYLIAGWARPASVSCVTYCSHTWASRSNCFDCNRTALEYTANEDFCIHNCNNRYWDRTTCKNDTATMNGPLASLPDNAELLCACRLCPSGQRRNTAGNGCE